jgi:2-polyprenyl-3-methyl-5-hydroxy-6-metoxy-1,4-benzoquinol methylase
MNPIRSLAKSVLNLYPRWLCKKEFKRQILRFNERPIEFAFVFRKLAELYPQTILDVGTGTTALPHLMRNCGFLVTATDNIRDYWTTDVLNRHYHVIDDDITNTRLKTTYDLITCISVLEHIRNFNDAIRNMAHLLNPGGHLILTCPYSEASYVQNVYDLPGSSYGRGAPYITQSFSRREVERWTAETKLAIAEQEFWQCWDGDHWTVGSQLTPPRRVAATDRHQLTCLHLRKVPHE